MLIFFPFRGDNTPVPKINLDPQKRPKQVLTVHHQGPFANRKRDYANLSRKSSVSSSEPSMSSVSSPVKEVQAKVPSPVHQAIKSEVTVFFMSIYKYIIFGFGFDNHYFSCFYFSVNVSFP